MFSNNKKNQRAEQAEKSMHNKFLKKQILHMSISYYYLIISASNHHLSSLCNKIEIRVSLVYVIKQKTVCELKKKDKTIYLHYSPFLPFSDCFILSLFQL